MPAEYNYNDWCFETFASRDGLEEPTLTKEEWERMIPIPSMDLKKTDPDALFLTDNGACYCGEHLGMSARFTGRDISGQAIHKLTPSDVAYSKTEGVTLRCETCGKVASLLWKGGK